MEPNIWWRGQQEAPWWREVMMANAAQQARGFNSSPFSQIVNEAGAEAGGKIGASVHALAGAAMLPGDVATGQTPFDPRLGLSGQDPATLDRAAELAGAIGLSALPITKPTNSLGMFGGRMAKTADLDALNKAQALEASGAPREAIWTETGWFKGADGEWRFEIDDSAASAGRNVLKEDFADVYRGRLDEALVHPELYAAYPEVGATPVSTHWKSPDSYSSNFGIELGTSVPLNRSFLDSNSRIDGQPNRTNPRYSAAGDIGRDLSVPLHETQHAVQAQEGFARGGNPEQFAELMPDPQAISDARVMAALVRKGVPVEEAPQAFLNMVGRDVAPEARELIRDMDALNAMPSDPMEAYKRLAGEVEARNVQTRMNMTPEQRKAQAPWLTQDVPDIQQIIRMRGL